MWWSSSSGQIELNIPKRLIHVGYHQGACDDDIAFIRKSERKIEAQLEKIDPATLCEVLKEAGAWDDADLADHDTNLDRLLWIACGDLADHDC